MTAWHIPNNKVPVSCQRDDSLAYSHHGKYLSDLFSFHELAQGRPGIKV
jgi:hypothetical protein